MSVKAHAFRVEGEDAAEVLTCHTDVLRSGPVFPVYSQALLDCRNQPRAFALLLFNPPSDLEQKPQLESLELSILYLSELKQQRNMVRISSCEEMQKIMLRSFHL